VTRYFAYFKADYILPGSAATCLQRDRIFNGHLNRRAAKYIGAIILKAWSIFDVHR